MELCLGGHRARRLPLGSCRARSGAASAGASRAPPDPGGHCSARAHRGLVRPPPRPQHLPVH
eukprot:6014097-Alexandrium_andersonii.AAC.1